MISIKMMKKAALRNLQKYATTEHIFGIGMATKKNEAALSPKKTNFSSVRTNDPVSYTHLTLPTNSRV